MKQLILEHVKCTSALLPAVRTADANGISIDRQGYSNVAFLFYVGAPGDTLSGSVKIEAELEESDDNSNWTDVANADVRSVATGATNTGCFAVIDANGEASSMYRASYLGTKRYVRLVANVTGTHTTGTPSSAVALLSEPRNVPVTQA